MSKLKVSRRWHWPLLLALSASLLAFGHDKKQQQVPPSQLVAERQLLTHPSGAVGMVTGDDQMTYSIATIGPDGKLKMECITGEKNAVAKVKAEPRKETSNDR